MLGRSSGNHNWLRACQRKRHAVEWKPGLSQTALHPTEKTTQTVRLQWITANPAVFGGRWREPGVIIPAEIKPGYYRSVMFEKVLQVVIHTFVGNDRQTRSTADILACIPSYIQRRAGFLRNEADVFVIVTFLIIVGTPYNTHFILSLKVGFHYPSSRPEFTGRVDGPRTRVHFLTPVNSGRELG